VDTTIANGKKLLKAGMIVFLLITVVGVFSPVPITESGYTENAQVLEVPETTESSANMNLEMMMFVQTASDDGGAYYICRRGSSAVAYFGMSEVHYLVGDLFFTLEFPGSNRVIPEGEKPTGSVTSYFYGSDSSQWKTGLADCAELRYNNLYPGIDLVYKIYNGFIKYEFIVSPGADPGLIRLAYSNAESISVEGDSVFISRDGNLLGDTGLHVFQSIDNSEHVVSSAFKSEASNEVAFDLGTYDATETLIIDPVNMAFSTYIGGSSNDYAREIEVENGYVYVTGTTYSTNFPAISGYNTSINGEGDCFVFKLAADGQTLIYSTYLGGSNLDENNGLAVENGIVYVVGLTMSTNFPTTMDAIDSTFNGNFDGYVTIIAADGQSLFYSTYGPVISTYNDMNMAIAVEDGAYYVTGSVYNGPSFLDDGFVAKCYGNATGVIYSIPLRPLAPGYATSNDIGMDIAVENGEVFVTGMTYSSNFWVNTYDTSFGGARDGFVMKINSVGGLVASTFIGGGIGDYGSGIAIENGYPYVIVSMNDNDYTLVFKMANSLASTLYITTLQGAGQDVGFDIAVEYGIAYIVGSTQSSNFPMVNAYNPTFGGGSTDGFVVSLAHGGAISYSTFIGGSDSDAGRAIAVENGYVFVAGETTSTNFPMVNAYNSTFGGSNDCFVSKFYLDTDCDGLSDIEEEYNLGTDPFKIDTDNDNFLDAYEVAYGSDPTDPMSYPAMPLEWYDAIYEDLDGNATLIQNLIAWSDGNSSLLQNVIQQLDENATLVQQVITWLDGNHTAIETLFTYVDGNASLLLDTVSYLEGNATRLEAVAALVTGNTDLISLLDTSVTGDIDEIRAIIDMLGASVGDVDYDGLDDLDEISYGTDIDCIDTDTDNLNDAFEVKIGTDPLDDDSDGDTYLDGLEVIAGTNPLDALDYPGATTPPPDNLLFIGVIVAGAGGVALVVVLVFLMKRKKAA
jgi:hypothetical protein